MAAFILKALCNNHAYLSKRLHLPFISTGPIRHVDIHSSCSDKVSANPMRSHNRDSDGSDSHFASAVHLSGEGLYGPVISKEETQSDPVRPSGKDDAQISNTSATDTKSDMPNDSTYPTTDSPLQECISTLTNQVDDFKIRISHLESGRNSTHQTPMAVTNDDNSVQQDDNTNPLKHRSGVPLSSNPTTSSFRQKHLTARILIRIACLYILVVILLQTFYAHYTNLRDSRFWWSAAYDWCFATDACNTKVGTPLKEGYDAGLASISAFWGVVEMTWFHCLDTITPWGTWIHWVGHILLACCIYHAFSAPHIHCLALIISTMYHLRGQTCNNREALVENASLTRSNSRIWNVHFVASRIIIKPSLPPFLLSLRYTDNHTYLPHSLVSCSDNKLMKTDGGAKPRYFLKPDPPRRKRLAHAKELVNPSA